jgi:hypothetical protein
MKKHIFIFLLSVAPSFVAFGYCDELRQASTWYGFKYYHEYPQEDYTPIISNLAYTLEGDTVINNQQYRQIRYTHEYENITNTYRGAIRQSTDKQQVYFVPLESNNEYLLYDFSVKEGDVVYAYNGFNDISCEEIAEQDQGESITPAWTVSEVKIIDGRKHILVQHELSSVEWIEGIGTKHILWPFGRTCYATGMELQFQHTLCAADSEGNILYSFDTNYLGIHNDCPNAETALENIPASTSSASKILHDGHLYIKRDGKMYTIQGIEVK